MATPDTPDPRERYDVGPELRVLTALRRIIRAVDIHSRKLSTRHRITAPQLVCLLEVVAHGPVTASALSKLVHLSPSTLVGIVDRLVAKDLVTRRRDDLDRRRVLISPTETGTELARNAPSPLQDTLSVALSELPEHERDELALSLERIVDLMEARHLDAAPMLETGPIDEQSPPS